MRLLKFGLLIGLFSSSFAVAQDGEVVTLEVVTLRMAAESATYFQKRIQEGGTSAEETMARVPDLVRAKKIVEVDRWSQETESGKVVEHLIAPGGHLNLTVGSKPAGIKLMLAATSYHTGPLDLRYTIDKNEKIVGDSANYRANQMASSCALSPNEWSILSNEKIDADQQLIVMKAKREKQGAPNDSAAVIQASLRVSVCTVGAASTAFDSKGRLFGGAAKNWLSTANVLTLNDFLFQVGQSCMISSNRYPISEEAEEKPDGFRLDYAAIYSADQKFGEFQISYQCDLAGKAGKRWKGNYNDFLSLPLGEPVLLLLSDSPPSKDGVVVLAITATAKTILPENGTSESGVIVNPSAQRLLAEAAGFTVSKPEKNYTAFASLPSMKESLVKLGFSLPADGYLRFDFIRPAIFTGGTRADNLRLKEILEKHLPPATQFTGK